MMNRIKTVRPKYQRRFTAIRIIIFMLIISVCFIFLCTGNFIKPVLLIPVAVCISVNEDELVSACTGVICGLLADVAFDRLFGYNAIILSLSCMSVSLLFSNLLRRNTANVFILTAVISFFQGFSDYLLYYLIWSSEDVSFIYREVILPSCIVNSLSVFVIYPLVKAVRNKFTPEQLKYDIDL